MNIKHSLTMDYGVLWKTQTCTDFVDVTVVSKWKSGPLLLKDSSYHSMSNMKFGFYKA